MGPIASLRAVSTPAPTLLWQGLYPEKRIRAKRIAPRSVAALQRKPARLDQETGGLAGSFAF